ncbi:MULTISPECIES: TetR family transcriptional regulator [unclassified Pseudonocardia]|jgi:AcrR family transcriptional regulator|uniref:TetR family transcriptional regulator n=1 Tax=unclassified Pseudonocardia TaxID=2619320 RepID=UPI0009699F35|nr:MULTISPECIES: TetR family transcriptional regulator [unclassified Pseudonocardia]MBN9101490.1 TetR family transcriptional regulator [Pseudonocardia sp.]OJY47366.1 MAG: hypothetical protein BGP03_30110 [Pseudonocardia sp. 73-21]
MAGLRERKKATTHAALRTAAIELSLEHGPEAVTIEAICARAEVSPRTFFNYFPGKDEAVVGWSAAESVWFADTVEARPPSEDPLTAVEAALADLIGLTTTSPIWHAQLELLRLHPRLLGLLTTASSRMAASAADGVARRTGLGVNDPQVLVLAAAAIAAFRVALARWLDSPEGTDGRVLLAEAIDMLRGGLEIS